VLEKFLAGVIQVFEQEYLRKSNQADVDRLLPIVEAHDFPNILGCMDCMSWKWKNYPTSWKAMFAKGIYKVLI